MKQEKRVQILPLLLLLIPLAVFILPCFSGFKDGEWAYCHVDGQTGISAASVNLYQSFSYSALAAAMFYAGLSVMGCLAVFIVCYCVIPTLRKSPKCSLIVLLCFGLSAILILLGHIFLANHVQIASKTYFEAVGRKVDETPGFAHANIFFYVEMLLPVIATGWWGWTMLETKKLEKRSD